MQPEVAVFVMRDQDRSIVLLRRTPADGGYRHVVEGRIEDGENPEGAAAIELREETGLVARIHLVGEATEPAAAETLMPPRTGSESMVIVTCFMARAPRHGSRFSTRSTTAIAGIQSARRPTCFDGQELRARYVRVVGDLMCALRVE